MFMDGFWAFWKIEEIKSNKKQRNGASWSHRLDFTVGAKDRLRLVCHLKSSGLQFLCKNNFSLSGRKKAAWRTCTSEMSGAARVPTADLCAVEPFCRSSCSLCESFPVFELRPAHLKHDCASHFVALHFLQSELEPGFFFSLVNLSFFLINMPRFLLLMFFFSSKYVRFFSYTCLCS